MSATKRNSWRQPQTIGKFPNIEPSDLTDENVLDHFLRLIGRFACKAAKSLPVPQLMNDFTGLGGKLTHLACPLSSN